MYEKLNFITLIGNPVLNSNANFISYNKLENITISEGWNVSIYSLERYKDHIHIDGDVTKTATATSNIAFTINNADLRPEYHNFTTTNQGKTGWLKDNGSFGIVSAEVGQTNFFSFEYLCL